jgi:hypothetical protein
MAASRRKTPARTAEAREAELVGLAYDLAEEQILAGTASSQVITHFVKAGSTRERLEHERMMEEMKVMRIKAEQLESQKRVEELYANALEAMRGYQGLGQPIEPDQIEAGD